MHTGALPAAACMRSEQVRQLYGTAIMGAPIDGLQPFCVPAQCACPAAGQTGAGTSPPASPNRCSRPGCSRPAAVLTLLFCSPPSSLAFAPLQCC